MKNQKKAISKVQSLFNSLGPQNHMQFDRKDKIMQKKRKLSEIENCESQQYYEKKNQKPSQKRKKILKGRDTLLIESFTVPCNIITDDSQMIETSKQHKISQNDPRDILGEFAPILINYLNKETNIYYQKPVADIKPQKEFLLMRKEMIEYILDKIEWKGKSLITFDKCVNLFDRVVSSQFDQNVSIHGIQKIVLTRSNCKLLILACLNIIAKLHEMIYFNQQAIVQWVNSDPLSTPISLNDLFLTEKEIFKLVQTHINSPTAISFSSLTLCLPEINFSNGNDECNFKSFLCELSQFFCCIQKINDFGEFTETRRQQAIKLYELANSSQSLIALYASIGIISGCKNPDLIEILQYSKVTDHLNAARSLLPYELDDSDIYNFCHECITRYAMVVEKTIQKDQFTEIFTDNEFQQLDKSGQVISQISNHFSNHTQSMIMKTAPREIEQNSSIKFVEKCMHAIYKII